MRLRFLLVRRTLFLLASVSTLLFSTRAIAAEQVMLKYSIFRQSIPVEDLSTFAETGKLSTSLRSTLALARQDPRAVRRLLTRPVKIDLVLLDRVLNSPVGNILSDEISQIIHTPAHVADRQALRAAMVLSASRNQNNITLMEILQNYPASSVEVEGEQLESAYNRLERLQGILQNLPIRR